VLSTPFGDVYVVRLPLRVRFRGVTSREVALLRGRAGWAEFGPFAEYDDATAAVWWQATLEAARVPWPAARRTSVPVNATVPAVPATQVADLLARFPGTSTAKVKVAEPGQSEAEDLERLAAVRDAMPAGHLRIDVNGAWSLDEAVARVPRYDRAARGLEYVEQPCATVEDLGVLRRRVDVPIAADESIRLGTDPQGAADAVDVVVLKVAPLGGVRAALRLADQLGRPVVVSSALDSSIGLAAGLALAAALDELPYACGLGTAALLAQDVTDDPLLAVDGSITPRRVEPAPVRLAALAVADDRAQWWRERIDRVMAAQA